ALSMREAGLALANTLTSAGQVILLGHALRRKMPKLDFGVLWQQGRLMLVAILVAGLLCWVLSREWERNVGGATLATRIGAVFIPALISAAAYFLMLWKLRVPACEELVRTIRDWRKKSG